MTLVAKLTPELLMAMPGGMEWIWILLAVILLFGGKKLPELAKGLGKGMRDFKEAKDGVKSDLDEQELESKKAI